VFQKLEDIDVWKRGCALAVAIYRLGEREPLCKDWALRDQMRRSAISIPSNIAEGYERNSRMEFRRFLFIAKGSCGELRTQLHILAELNLLPLKDVNTLIQECISVSSMIQGLASRISSQLSK